jgi:hypothetical protein
MEDFVIVTTGVQWLGILAALYLPVSLLIAPHRRSDRG